MEMQMFAYKTQVLCFIAVVSSTWAADYHLVGRNIKQNRSGIFSMETWGKSTMVLPQLRNVSTKPYLNEAIPLSNTLNLELFQQQIIAPQFEVLNLI